MQVKMFDSAVVTENWNMSSSVGGSVDSSDNGIQLGQSDWITLVDEISSDWVEEEDSLDSTSPDDELMGSADPIECPPRKKRIRNRKRNLAPRVLKHDVRKRFAEMFANVYNMGDANVISSFFRTFSTPNVEMTKMCASYLTLKPKLIRVTEPRYVAQYWAVMQELMPDGVVKVENVRVVTRSDTESSTVICTMNAKYTNFYEEPAPYIAAGAVEESIAKLSKRADSDGNCIESTTRKRSRSDSDVAAEGPNYLMPLSAFLRGNPSEVLLVVTVTFHVNAQKQFEKLSFTNPILVFS